MSWIHRRTICLNLMLLGFAAPGLSPALASEQSNQLVQAGFPDLEAGHASAALQNFEAAAKADPQDGEAAFYCGVALNRLGRYPAALEKLKFAVEMRVQRDDIGFEMGWALLGDSQYQAAIDALNLYEATAPGRGQTSEFVGRAYFGLGDTARAEQFLEEAAQRDPKLKPTTEYYLALIEEKTGHAAEARDRLAGVTRDFPDSPLTAAVRRGDFALQEPRPYRLFVSTGFGTNSNVIALGNTIPLPADISHKSSLFGTLNLGGTYDWKLASGDTLRAGYSFLGNSYEAVHPADLEDHYLYGEYERELSGKLGAALQISDEYSRIGGSKFRNQIGVRPALALHSSARSTTELALDLDSSNYYFPTAALQNRDGKTEVLNLTHYFQSTSGRWQARAGYFHLWNNADGADYDLHSNGILAGVSHPLPYRFQGSLLYSRSMDRYQNPNSLTGFTNRRKDNTDSVSIQLARPLSAKTSLYIQYNYNRDGSNIPVFNYHQNILSTGVTAIF